MSPKSNSQSNYLLRNTVSRFLQQFTKLFGWCRRIISVILGGASVSRGVRCINRRARSPQTPYICVCSSSNAQTAHMCCLQKCVARPLHRFQGLPYHIIGAIPPLVSLLTAANRVFLRRETRLETIIILKINHVRKANLVRRLRATQFAA